MAVSSAKKKSRNEDRSGREAVVADLMTSRVFTLRPSDDLEAARDLMDTHHIRHIPIVDRDGNLIGLVTERDLVRAPDGIAGDLPLSMQEDLLRTRRIREIMSTEVETVEAEQSLKAAAEMLLEIKIGCLPVVEGSRLTGILTEADFVRDFATRA